MKQSIPMSSTNRLPLQSPNISLKIRDKHTIANMLVRAFLNVQNLQEHIGVLIVVQRQRIKKSTSKVMVAIEWQTLAMAKNGCERQQSSSELNLFIWLLIGDVKIEALEDMYRIRGYITIQIVSNMIAKAIYDELYCFSSIRKAARNKGTKNIVFNRTITYIEMLPMYCRQIPGLHSTPLYSILLNQMRESSNNKMVLAMAPIVRGAIGGRQVQGYVHAMDLNRSVSGCRMVVRVCRRLMACMPRQKQVLGLNLIVRCASTFTVCSCPFDKIEFILFPYFFKQQNDSSQPADDFT